jgi:hypothetical protein
MQGRQHVAQRALRKAAMCDALLWALPPLQARTLTLGHARTRCVAVAVALPHPC